MMARRLSIGGLLLALTALTATGCTVELTYDPFGTDFSVSGEWTVNGEAPSAAVCSAAGIQSVRLVMYDGVDPYYYDNLTFACSAGSFATAEIFAWGSYTTEWQAVLTDGTIVKGPMLPLIVNSPTTHANLAGADFVIDAGFDPRGSDATISADWNINGAPATAALCTSSGIETMAVVFYEESDTTRSSGVQVAMAPCSAGKYDSRPMNIVANGRYLTSIQALDAGGSLLGSFDSEFVLDVNSTVAHYMLMTADFTTATSLTIEMGWDTDPSGTMVDGDCATAGVTNMSYDLKDDGGTTYDAMSGVTCADELSWDDIPAGTYSLWVDAEGAGGLKWGGTCTMLVVEDGNAELYNCFYDQM